MLLLCYITSPHHRSRRTGCRTAQLHSHVSLLSSTIDAPFLLLSATTGTADAFGAHHAAAAATGRPVHGHRVHSHQWRKGTTRRWWLIYTLMKGVVFIVYMFPEQIPIIFKALHFTTSHKNKLFIIIIIIIINTLIELFPTIPRRSIHATGRGQSLHDARADAEQQSERVLPARRSASGHDVLGRPSSAGSLILP